jgi:hypothetical protein
MSKPKPTEEFWFFVGLGAVFFLILAGNALLVWAGGD